MTRRTNVALIALALLLMASPTIPRRLAGQELTTEQATRKCVEALGGQANWDGIHSLRYSGRFSTFSVSRPFVVYRQRPNLYRFDHFYGDGEMTTAHDGEMSWWINRSVFSHVSWPEPAPPVHSQAILAESDFGLPMLDTAEKGHEIELLGRRELDGEETLLLEVRLAHGAVEHWHLDPKSFRPMARISRGADARQEVAQNYFFLDYRKIGGIFLPHQIEIELGFRYQSIVIDDVLINPEIDEKLFHMPLPAGMERLQFMAGIWNVRARSRPYPRMPWSEEQVTSTVRSISHGALLEEDLTYSVYFSPRLVRRSLSYDRFRHVFRVTRFDSLTSHVDVLEGTMVDGRLMVTNLDTGTTWRIGEETFHARETFFDISADSFKVKWELSSDGGASWETYSVLTYTRDGASS